MFRSWFARLGSPLMAALREARALSGREAGFLLSETAQLRTLLPLLTRSRDDRKWSAIERAELHGQLRRLSTLSPYLVLALMPGSFLALPLLAWWRDRRRGRSNDLARACAKAEKPV